MRKQFLLKIKSGRQMKLEDGGIVRYGNLLLGGMQRQRA